MIFKKHYGVKNILQITLNMTYEHFLEQVNLAEQLTSSDFGVSTGLIHQGYWEASKWFFVNVEVVILQTNYNQEIST
jgi:hypothetical protein